MSGPQHKGGRSFAGRLRAGHVRPLHGSKKGCPLRTASRIYYAFVFAGRLNSTSIKKMQPKPRASHSVNGEPNTKVLIIAAVTGSAKLYRLDFCGPMSGTPDIYRLNASTLPSTTTVKIPNTPIGVGT